MQNNKFKSYIGFSIKSGSLIFGFDNIVTCKKKIKLIIVDDTTNMKNIEKLKRYASLVGCEIIKSNILIGELTSKENVKSIALVNIDLANAILQNCKDEMVTIEKGEINIGK